MFRVIGPGRAGGALQRALEVGGRWSARPALRRGDSVAGAALDVELVVIATPDRLIAEVAASIVPVADVVIMHLSGAFGLGVLAPHVRRAALHPLMTLADAERGAAMLRGAWFAVAGDAVAGDVVATLDGRSFTVAADHRALYHAAASVASNHVVALLAQVERLANAADVPYEAFFDLVRASVDNCASIGPTRALTGPASRGDDATLDRHRAALADRERPAYEAMVDEIKRLVS